MILHFFRLIAFSFLFGATFSGKIRNKIRAFTAVSVMIAMLVATPLWFEYSRIFLPYFNYAIGKIPDKIIALSLNSVGTVVTFMLTALLLKYIGKIVCGNYEMHAYMAMLDILHGAIPVTLKKVKELVFNGKIIKLKRSFLSLNKRCEHQKSREGNTILFEYSRILI